MGGIATPLREVTGVAEGEMLLVCLQEVPQEQPGWDVKEYAPWTFVSHRNDCVWRGQAIGFRTGEWTVMRRRACRSAMALRLRRVSDGLQLWILSCYFVQGSTIAAYAERVSEAMTLVPATHLPIVIAEKANAAFRWTEGDGAPDPVLVQHGSASRFAL